MTPFEIGATIGIWAATGIVGLILKLLWKMAKQTDELWDVHLGMNAIDEDRTPKWYVRKSLEDQVKNLAEAINALKDTLRDLHVEHLDMQKSVNQILENTKKPG